MMMMQHPNKYLFSHTLKRCGEVNRMRFTGPRSPIGRSTQSSALIIGSLGADMFFSLTPFNTNEGRNP